MEFEDGGDLQQKINALKEADTYLDEKEIWAIFIKVIRGLSCLHKLKVVHRDIKCANVFLTKAGAVKLGDLNVSKLAKLGNLHTQTGTPQYASPEVWED